MSEQRTDSSSIGDPIDRFEDESLITGDAIYTDDLSKPDMAYLSIVRSQYAHAEIESIDTQAAREQEGVIDVFTAKDVRAAETSTPRGIPVIWHASAEQITPPPLRRQIIAEEKVRYQGEAVALVIAEDRYTAHNACNLIDVDYTRLDQIVDPVESVESDSPVVHDEAPDNIAYDWEFGEEHAVDQHFEEAEYTAELEIENQRIIANPIEPRAALADYNQSTDTLELSIPSQNPHIHRKHLSHVLDRPEHGIHISVPNVGGGFGSKICIYSGEVLAAWCALHLGQPIKWQAIRSESYMNDSHGRGLHTEGRIAVDEDGSIIGLHVENVADLGAYVTGFAPRLSTDSFAGVLSGQYEIPSIYCRTIGALTNKAPLEAYRGVEVTEAIQILERLVDQVAREMNVDPATLREQNFIPSDQFPYKTATEKTYDSADFETAFEKALNQIGYESARERQQRLQDDGRYLGIGISCFVEFSGLGPSEACVAHGSEEPYWEHGAIRFHPSGSVTVHCGTADQGQGHPTVYRQIVSDKLGIPMEDIEVVEGDTNRVKGGMGTYASRSAPVGGGAVARSAEKVLEKAKAIATHQFEVAKENIVFDDGVFSIEGMPDQSMEIQEVAEEAYLARNLPQELEPTLDSTAVYDPDNSTTSFGTHVAIVEIKPQTGDIEICRYVAVDDCGVQINPTIVEGQVHGAVAQGIGQALYEAATYDDNGNLVTSSHMDYILPKSHQIPNIETEHTVTPSPHNPIGAKGVGESGTIAAPAAIMNAIDDALRPFSTDPISPPASPEMIWQIIHNNEGFGD